MEKEKEIRRAVDTGKVCFGIRESELSLLQGRGKLVIKSGNIPEADGERIAHVAKISGIPVLCLKKSSRQLGSICGKPFPVSVMVVLEEGKSKVLGAVRKQ